VKVVRSVAEMREVLAPSHRTVVGLVPTMGALHAGHLAMLRTARAECDVLVASVFVNPAQFSDAPDLASYPRNLDHDLAVADAEQVDLVFAPAENELYPPGFATWVVPEGAAVGLEGEHRPGHFKGVATVCLKLFNVVRPQLAWFGRKDAQQVAVIKQIVRDLNLDVEIRVVDTVRDADGLAISSRNSRLTAAERERALAIPKALATKDVQRAQSVLTAAGIEPDYVAVADLDGPTLAIAARVGGTRLIDNVPIEEGELR